MIDDDLNHSASGMVERPGSACACCGGSRLAKIGEDVTKTLEEIPRRFKRKRYEYTGTA